MFQLQKVSLLLFTPNSKIAPLLWYARTQSIIMTGEKSN
jgi:hypothetical protein